MFSLKRPGSHKTFRHSCKGRLERRHLVHYVPATRFRIVCISYPIPSGWLSFVVLAHEKVTYVPHGRTSDRHEGFQVSIISTFPVLRLVFLVGHARHLQ